MTDKGMWTFRRWLQEQRATITGNRLAKRTEGLKKMVDNRDYLLDKNVLLCIIILMSDIRNAILQQMSSLGLSSYRVSKMVEDHIPKRTVYAFLSGEKDTGTKTASIPQSWLLHSRRNDSQFRQSPLAVAPGKTAFPETVRGEPGF